MSRFSLRHYHHHVCSHSHDFAQLVIPLDGPLEIEVQGRGRRLAPGSACIIAPGERHDYAADPALSFLVQESDWLPGDLAARPFIELDEPQRHYLAFLHRMVAEGRQVAGMEQVWLSLLAEGQGMQSAVIPRLAARILKVQRHIDANLAAPLTNQQLAAIACLGQSQFKLAFRQQLGMSVSHYIRSRRMALARTLLAGTQLPVGEIASRCGYQNQGAFSERFLAETGLTPSLWRQQNGRLPQRNG
ncbi:AraC family transcriptional regulator [Aeromonas veronii]|uniref:AraC family transcriptional regulator n=1 Tax=Aeromonas veronii TaxID=654 RepID=UPI001933A63A|nr:AraC family transcriptional regulator [Aeromonas veronii]EKP0293970.1 helix-turn-helix domain-containing protein [Aeromonas veronii]MBM0419008.1 helix-turn-helix domain-containing protein [Aeromonas veronii]MBW3790975.1 AraC family transcriptional regulator [Aeromonas veronii]